MDGVQVGSCSWGQLAETVNLEVGEELSVPATWDIRTCML